MKFLKKLFGSKKFLALLAGLVVAVLNAALDLQIQPDTLIPIFGMLGAYIVGQGVADSGKEAVLLSGGGPKANLPAITPDP